MRRAQQVLRHAAEEIVLRGDGHVDLVTDEGEDAEQLRCAGIDVRRRDGGQERRKLQLHLGGVVLGDVTGDDQLAGDDGLVRTAG